MGVPHVVPLLLMGQWHCALVQLQDLRVFSQLIWQQVDYLIFSFSGQSPLFPGLPLRRGRNGGLILRQWKPPPPYPTTTSLVSFSQRAFLAQELPLQLFLGGGEGKTLVFSREWKTLLRGAVLWFWLSLYPILMVHCTSQACLC